MILLFLAFFSLFLQTTLGNNVFPDDFLFGVSTSAYQIEGGWNANGKGESIWDVFSHNNPDKIIDNSTGDVAADSYHQFREDLANLIYLGVHFYRFSISWPRVLPTGFINHVNPDGVKYYSDIIDQLLSNKIEPMVTMYNWDLPAMLQELGGWTNPNIGSYFVDYADFLFSKFSHKVKYWITFNEPGEICETGYGLGLNAPGINMSGIADYLCGKTVLLSHSKVYRLYKSKYNNGKLGISISTPWYEPKNKNVKADVKAAERAMQMEFGWWAHPIFSRHGDYPDIMKDRIKNLSLANNFTGTRLPYFSKDEIKRIRGSADFLGLNHYTTYLVSPNDYNTNLTSHVKDVGVKKEIDPKWPASKARWLKVVPWGLEKLLIWIKNEYNNPCIYITENGYPDDGGLLDMDRVRYLAGYIKSMLKAMQESQVNVKGYAVWSLMDNWEWIDGFTLKFGLYQIDYDDCARIRKPKSSVNFYRDLIHVMEIPAICFEGAPVIPKIEHI
ncbi:myrosinase 1-like isoform X1 [Onthophagus taurus]|uniref:myrosinase 1-like isoform X1 n=1 Tax=Onthophagus taurus TaxID=166361 RepID=UPI000C20761E|nr:myrosinase 1-like isoform X1 [Onthophagus taurus]